MIKIQCNRCGKEIDARQEVGYIHFGCLKPFEGMPLANDDNIYERNHYCEDCMAEIWEFMQHKQENVPKKIETVNEPLEEPRQEQKAEEPKKRQRIDIGKIMALKNAGWSVAKIADEMGMQPQAVSNAIYQQKKRMEASKVV